MSVRIAAVFFTLFVALAAGCGESCVQGAMRCNGKSIEVCLDFSDGGDQWTTMGGCDVACEVITAGPLVVPVPTCVDSATEVDVCANSGPACWNGAPTTCVEGYPTKTQTACAAPDVCAVANGAATCGAP
jgi:hypothetical protein